MDYAFLSPSISKADALTSSASMDLLHAHLTELNHSLVFFVGAGASISGNTGMPSTPALLHHLLLQALSSSGKFDIQNSTLPAILKEISTHIGFEITLNDFWQICRQATALLYESFAEVEARCISNRVHAFLAYWLFNGGTVITTNYDRLIERELVKIGGKIQSRYQERFSHSFEQWKEDLDQGGVLFKIHGSLDDSKSCLGALEHVGTQLIGTRAEFLQEVVRTRPLCFVGWRGVDPDIPPLLYNMLEKRDPLLPTFWIHHEGRPPGSISLQKNIEECSNLIRPYASELPILTDADRAFGEILNWLGIQSNANPARQAESFDFSKAIAYCSKSGLSRMVGITLRRAKRYEEADMVLKAALELAKTPAERNSALQETALLQQQITGRDTDQARASLKQAHKSLENEPDIHLQLNTDFGLLSMSIIALKKRPWLLFSLPGLFRKYQKDIEALQKEAIDNESVALHKSLFHLYTGRLRFKLLGWLGSFIFPLSDWILQPFNVARSMIGDAKDIHLHSRIDVLSYRAIALANLGRCREAQKDVPEIRRLLAILNDDARTQHWKKQTEEIDRYCSQD
jgi:tetratricopeptide (TPR) repeat protein